MDLTLTDLAERKKTDAEEITQYLTEREQLTSLTFRIGRKLGVKIQNPVPFVDEYVEKWYNYGFEENSLLDLALFCMKTERSDFHSLDELVDKLFKLGFITKDAVKEFLKTKNDELKLFSKLREVCSAIRYTAANLSMLETWRDWKFSDEMILEAAKRSATSASPIPYMNKILSDWKRADVYEVKNIPEGKTTGAGTSSSASARVFVNPIIEAVNAKADRERYYSALQEKAQSRADKFVAKANKHPRFKEVNIELSKMEIALAKAEVFEPTKLPSLTEKKAALLRERKDILQLLGIDESDLLPKYTCEKCSDTGFLPNGIACDCYKPS